MSRLIVYGDVHGCLDELIALRAKINIQEDDVEICVGDVITKGSNSNKTIKFLRKKGIFSVLGNNEEILLRYINEREKKSSIKLDEDRKNIVKHLSLKDIEFLNSLPYFIQVDRYTIVHGGLQNSMKIDKLTKRDKEKIIRMRYLSQDGTTFLKYGSETKKSVFWADIYDGSNGFVLYGHQRFKEPKLSSFAIGLDTGCVYGDKLTALVIENDEKRFVSVNFGERYV
jgi:bis(5'-nucleosyl)-tetraphosphatase (symmetrical)